VGLSSAGKGGWEEVLHMQTSTLFGVKNSGFFEVYGVFARTKGRGGGGAVRTRRGEEVKLSRFCADVFSGRPVKIFAVRESFTLLFKFSYFVAAKNVKVTDSKITDYMKTTKRQLNVKRVGSSPQSSDNAGIDSNNNAKKLKHINCG